MEKEGTAFESCWVLSKIQNGLLLFPLKTLWAVLDTENVIKYTPIKVLQRRLTQFEKKLFKSSSNT